MRHRPSDFATPPMGSDEQSKTIGPLGDDPAIWRRHRLAARRLTTTRFAANRRTAGDGDGYAGVAELAKLWAACDYASPNLEPASCHDPGLNELVAIHTFGRIARLKPATDDPPP
jgi:hypothetical protein